MRFRVLQISARARARLRSHSPCRVLSPSVLGILGSHIQASPKGRLCMAPVSPASCRIAVAGPCLAAPSAAPVVDHLLKAVGSQSSEEVSAPFGSFVGTSTPRTVLRPLRFHRALDDTRASFPCQSPRCFRPSACLPIHPCGLFDVCASWLGITTSLNCLGPSLRVQSNHADGSNMSAISGHHLDLAPPDATPRRSLSSPSHAHGSVRPALVANENRSRMRSADPPSRPLEPKLPVPAVESTEHTTRSSLRGRPGLPVAGLVPS